MSGAKQQSEGITVARVPSGLALSEGVVGLGVRAPRFGGERNLPRDQAEGVADPLKISRGHR